MDMTVRQHVERLQARLNDLNAEFMEQTDAAIRNRLESEIRVVELALSHFQAALELEQNLTKR